MNREDVVPMLVVSSLTLVTAVVVTLAWREDTRRQSACAEGGGVYHCVTVSVGKYIGASCDCLTPDGRVMLPKGGGR